jgi:mRNA interferase RelE/StbE
MPYHVSTPKRVQKQLDALSQDVFERVDDHITALCDNPRPPGVKQLKGLASAYRVRVGDYRIVYEVDDTAQEIRLITIGNRKDVYT